MVDVNNVLCSMEKYWYTVLSWHTYHINEINNGLLQGLAGIA